MRNYAFLSMLKKYINSSVILVVVTVAALIVANSPWGDSYRDLWELPVSVSVGKFNLFSHSAQELSLLDFINDDRRRIIPQKKLRILLCLYPQIDIIKCDIFAIRFSDMR